MPSSASSTTVVLSAFVTTVFAALIADATLPAVASLFASPVATDGVAPAVIVPVTAETLPFATLIVVLSVSTDTPPSRLIPPFAFALTDTPLASTVRPPLAFALTETLLSAETEIPSPAVTGVLPPAVAEPPCGCSALIVTTCLPVTESVVVVTVTPSPLNSTSSPLFTIEAVLPLPFAETFQPKSFNAVDKFPALTNFFLLSSSGVVTLPFSTVSSTVSAATLLLSSIFNPSPVFTLNLAERPF